MWEYNVTLLYDGILLLKQRGQNAPAEKILLKDCVPFMKVLVRTSLFYSQSQYT